MGAAQFVTNRGGPTGNEGFGTAKFDTSVAGQTLRG